MDYFFLLQKKNGDQTTHKKPPKYPFILETEKGRMKQQ